LHHDRGRERKFIFQSTQVTGTFVVTENGQATEMGQIADMVTAPKRTRYPLQGELDGMTKVFGLIARLAVAVVAIFSIARGQDLKTPVLPAVATRSFMSLMWHPSVPPGRKPATWADPADAPNAGAAPPAEHHTVPMVPCIADG
jgi:E1-E2 ATPase